MPDLSHPDLRFRTVGTPFGFGFRRIGRWQSPGQFLIFAALMLPLDIYVGWRLPAVFANANTFITVCMSLLCGILAFCTITPCWQAWNWRQARAAYAQQTQTPDLGWWREWDDWQQARDERAFLQMLSGHGVSNFDLPDAITVFLLASWQAAHIEGAANPHKLSLLRTRIRESVLQSGMPVSQQQELADRLYDLARLADAARAEGMRARDQHVLTRLQQAVHDAAQQLGLDL